MVLRPALALSLAGSAEPQGRWEDPIGPSVLRAGPPALPRFLLAPLGGRCPGEGRAAATGRAVFGRGEKPR